MEIEKEKSQPLILLGKLIRQARESKHLTQEQLGQMIGVKKAQVSRIENGENLSFSKMSRVFKALKIPAYFDIESIGKVALW